MNENLIDKVTPDFNLQFCASNKHEINQVFQDNDSDSSILNLLDGDLSDKTPEETSSPYYSIIEQMNQESMHYSKPSAKPDIKSEIIDQHFENLLLAKLPQIIAIDKASIQYEVFDQNYPCLSRSFKNGFNSPVLDLLVVVLNREKLVSFYEGYFAGIPRLANELIDLNNKYWKSLISNNDENVWENHYKSVTDKFNSLQTNEYELEAGPVIRCRLRTSNNQQFNQQFNYFFVQPCSYMIKLDKPDKSYQVLNLTEMERNVDNIYMVSYINIMRECDTEYALKGSAAASLQKVITNSTNPIGLKLNSLSENVITKRTNSRGRKSLNNGQLSVNVSTPVYINSEDFMLNAPLTYPLINEHQYPKQRSQIQQHPNPHRLPMPTKTAIGRGVSFNILDTNQYQSHYQAPQSTSTLQYILENRNSNYSNNKNVHSGPLPMMSQHSQPFQNNIRPNASSCYLPLEHTQSIPSICSISSPTSFLTTRHLVPMSSNGILLSSDQYFRNSHQINVMDSIQVAQNMMTVVRPMSSNLNHGNGAYYCSTAPSQNLHVINTIPNQSLLSGSSLSSYCNDKNKLVHITTTAASQPYHGNQINMSIKSESYDMEIPTKEWHISPMMEGSSTTRYYDQLNTMVNDSISFDIVEEILKAEESKSENKQQLMSQSNSDNSDQLPFDLDDFILLDQGNNTEPPTQVTTSETPIEKKYDREQEDMKCNKQTLKDSDSISSLKYETLEKFSNAQKIGIKNLVNKHKNGLITKKQMLQQINEFVSSTLGKDIYHRSIIEYWNTKHPGADSTLSNINCSHVIQSPEEGPGISPTEHAAQSTTDVEEDKELHRKIPKLTSKKYKEDTNSDISQKYSKSKSATKGPDASIYNITSTTSTGVLETLLNEHDNPVHSDKKYPKVNSNTKLSVSSLPKSQLSLDQLLMDDECSMLSNFNPSQDNKVSFNQKTSEVRMRQLSSSNKSQPSTPCVSGGMGVLESLLNQNNPSMYRIRQKSTESILKHSRPSRQNSSDTFHGDVNNATEYIEKDNGIRKNSLLITLLNNSNGNSSMDKYSPGNSSNSVSMDLLYSGSQSKRQKMSSKINTPSNQNNTIKKPADKFSNNGMDIFDFDDCEVNCNTTASQSGIVTSSQPISAKKIVHGKRNRKRCYSKEMSIESDDSSDKVSISDKTLSRSSSNDKKVILTSLLENRNIEDATISTATSHLFSSLSSNSDRFVDATDRPVLTFDDSLDFEDIKIDDFDLEHLIDISEQLDDASMNENRTSSSSIQTTQDSGMFSDTLSVSSFDPHNTPLYTMVPPVINISQSEPIIPVSKQSILRVSDKNSILFSAIQSAPTNSTITLECLDNERERLLKQQQQQKLSIGGKYQLCTSDVDSIPHKISRTLSLDLLSKQMKEVGPNVMVEPSNNVDIIQSRKTSSVKSSVISPLSNIFPGSVKLPSSPIGRSLTSQPMSVQAESGKTPPAMSPCVNHQQVREGLRLLVSNRSAQNNSKNIPHNQRSNSSSNLNETLNTNSDFIGTRVSDTKSMIHYHSDTQVSNPQTESSVSSAVSNLYSTSSVGTISKTTNILEDSLVNDVFGLEELVNSKKFNPVLENISYKSNTRSGSSSELLSSPLNNNAQLFSMSSDLGSPQLSTVHSNIRQPHHHHHLQHYHHHHPHHHHHEALAPQPINEATAVQSKDKSSVNSNSGLLETLLSR